MHSSAEIHTKFVIELNMVDLLGNTLNVLKCSTVSALSTLKYRP